MAAILPSVSAQAANDDIENPRPLKWEEVATTRVHSGHVPVRKWQEVRTGKIAVEITSHPLRDYFLTDKLLLVLPPQAALR